MIKHDEILDIESKNSEIETIKKAIKDSKDKRMYQRYMVILHHLKGSNNRTIADAFGLCQHTVGTYIRKYKKDGLSGLNLQYSPGAPRMLTKVQEERLVEVITTKTPDEVGFAPRKNWTISIIRQWVINNFAVEYSPRGMAEVLYRLNLSYTKPTYTLEKADVEKQETFKEKFDKNYVIQLESCHRSYMATLSQVTLYQMSYYIIYSFLQDHNMHILHSTDYLLTFYIINYLFLDHLQ